MCTEKTDTGLTEAEVVANETVGGQLKLMSLRVDGWERSAPRPGQFIMLRVGPGLEPLLARPFGVAGFRVEGSAAVLDILYRVVGRGTTLMARLPAGGRVAFLGPLGRGFPIPEAGGQITLVAGGVGLPPLLFLASTLAEQGRADEVTLLYGETSRERLLDPGHTALPPVDLQICTDDGSYGGAGLVTDLLGQRVEEGTNGLYVCGPAAMMAAVFGMTSEMRSVSWYSLEARMACGFGVCSGCAVMTASGSYDRVCVNGPVFCGAELSVDSFV